MSDDESELYPKWIVARAMDKKVERESQNDLTGMQGASNGDMTLSETVCSDWCEPLSVEPYYITACGFRISQGCWSYLMAGKEKCTEAQKSDTDLIKL